MAAGFLAVLDSMTVIPDDVEPRSEEEFAALASMTTEQLAGIFSPPRPAADDPDL